MPSGHRVACEFAIRRGEAEEGMRLSVAMLTSGIQFFVGFVCLARAIFVGRQTGKSPWV